MAEIPLLGEAASLSAACCWAVAVTLFRRPVEEHGAWAVNLAKSSISTLFLGATLLLSGGLGALVRTPPASLGVVALSGVVGLTLGDTALFAAVSRLGVHRTLLFQTLGPAFAALLEIGVYGEPLHAGRLAGVAVVLAGVALVVAPAGRERARADLAGTFFAVLAACGQGAGVVLAKDGMSEMPLVAASFLRLLAATLAMLCVMAWLRRLRRALTSLVSWPALRQVTPPTLLGTYLAFLLMMAGIALSPASVAAVLLATSPIFSLFIDRFTTGTPITLRRLAGTLVAVVGVGVLSVAR